MNILFIHGVSDLYGASRSLLRLVTRLVQDGHEVTVVLAEDGPLVPRIKAAGAKVCLQAGLPVIHRHLLRSPRGWVRLVTSWPRAVRGITALARDVRADLIHTNQAMIPGVGARVARRIGIPHIQHVREFFSEALLLWPIYRRFLCHGSSRIICVSRAVAAQFHPDDSRIVVLHNGFPRAEFEGISLEAVNAFREEHCLKGHPCAGVIGRIKMGRKGQDVFLRAAAKIVQNIPHTRFVLIGSPFPGNESHERRLRDMVSTLGLNEHVIWTGEMEDPRIAMAALDVVVQPAVMPEPFGGTVIEAMALAKPVVATATGGTPEQIEDGITGLLVPPGDTDLLEEAIEKLIVQEPLRLRMGNAGRRRFFEVFEFDTFYTTLINLYEHV